MNNNIFSSEQEKLVTKLIKDFGFWKPTAIAFIEAGGECVYCGENLYSDRLHYYSQNIDHVYQKAKYPDLENEQCNLVLSCFKCNSLKKIGTFVQYQMILLNFCLMIKKAYLNIYEANSRMIYNGKRITAKNLISCYLGLKNEDSIVLFS